MARLFTVVISRSWVPYAGFRNIHQLVVECEFAGKRFSRENEDDLKKWVRVAAKNVYGKDTQVIFVHSTEGNEQS